MAYTSVIDVMLLLIRDGTVLLAERSGTGFADGYFNCPSGKVEQGEDVAAALCREAREEVGLHLHPGSLVLASTVHFRNEYSDARLGLFFHAPSWQGEPVNAEPHKCARIDWFPLNALPDNTYPYTRVGIDLYRTGRNFAVSGWTTDPG
ncbi:8-oxo-dGTP diphosphatase [Frankia sp. AiPs1]|uniref:NUDIX hydrolase n=1 Tax=Frankia sp. AiPa1 TaxID=573492 RepID=UPI00202B6708|nr:NUDIX domain-containing protein [Frankia sp. AiPa1]MCL9759278.1 NUDIX domain-containing protein [Frankia sp. AiPa1]